MTALAYADVGRAGLGNMLMPWARCRVWSWQVGAEMLAPTWFTFRVGPYVRREPDKRRYHTSFHSNGYVAGPRKWLALAFRPRVNGDVFRPVESGRSVLVVFRGLDGTFPFIRGHHIQLRQELLRITRWEHRPPEVDDGPFVAVHVRMGDFQIPNSTEELVRGDFNLRQPLSWYAAVIKEIRRVSGSGPLFRVFSDGNRQDLDEVLALPGVELVERKNAIADLLRMSRASLLLASGSSFSMWASFLGQVPTIWFPGQLRLPLLEGPARDTLEVEWGGGPLPTALEGILTAGLRQETPGRFHDTKSNGLG